MAKNYRIRLCILCKDEYNPTNSLQRYCTKLDDNHRIEKRKNKNINNYRSYNSKGKFTSKYKIKRRQYWLNKYKIAKGCDICEFKEHPSALDFDHLDPCKKEFTISRGFDRSLKILFNEIRKCQLLCANHHRILTKKQNIYYSKRTGLSYQWEYGEPSELAGVGSIPTRSTNIRERNYE